MENAITLTADDINAISDVIFAYAFIGCLAALFTYEVVCYVLSALVSKLNKSAEGKFDA